MPSISMATISPSSSCRAYAKPDGCCRISAMAVLVISPRASASVPGAGSARRSAISMATAALTSMSPAVPTPMSPPTSSTCSSRTAPLPMLRSPPGSARRVTALPSPWPTSMLTAPSMPSSPAGAATASTSIAAAVTFAMPASRPGWRVPGAAGAPLSPISTATAVSTSSPPTAARPRRATTASTTTAALAPSRTSPRLPDWQRRRGRWGR